MSSVLAVFARAPELGCVKTRLARTHGDEFALELSRAMLLDTLELCAQIEVSTRLFLTPDDFDFHSLWNGEVHPQGEGNLWTRLLRADARLRKEGFERIVILGSDAPDTPPRFLEAALASLEDRPLVVGPSLDGGFYLIGSARHLPDRLFENVPVSSRETLAHLTENLHQLRRRDFDFRLLTAWRDVDDDEDLGLFIKRLQSSEDAAPHCRKMLKEHGLI